MPYTDAADGARIYYRTSGPRRAEPLVLIMGLGWDMTGWQLLMPHLADYRVLRIDNRGTGRSDKPDRPYSVRQMALDVIRCMNATGVDSAHVYGASLGSMIAQELALSYPERARTLILGCPSPGIIWRCPAIGGRSAGPGGRGGRPPSRSRPPRVSPDLVGDHREDEVAGPGAVMEEQIALGQHPVHVGRGLAGAGVAVVAREIAGAHLEPKLIAGKEDMPRRPEAHLHSLNLTRCQ